MLEIIALIFLCKRIGRKAADKGLPAGRWKLITVLMWIGFEVLGAFIGAMLFGFDRNDVVGLMAFSVACAFGGYLLVKAVLDKQPDRFNQDEINNIGNN